MCVGGQRSSIANRASAIGSAFRSRRNALFLLRERILLDPALRCFRREMPEPLEAATCMRADPLGYCCSVTNLHKF